MSASILLIIEQATVRDFLTANLRHAGYVTTESRSGRETSEALLSIAPDLILVDAMADENVLLKIAGLRQGRPGSLPCLMLGKPPHGSPFHPDQTLPTPLNARTLLAAVTTRLAPYQRELDAGKLVIDGLDLDPARHEVHHRGQSIAISGLEFGLLHYLMQHPERVHPRDHLLSRVWGPDIFNGERTVDVAIRRLRSTLEPHGLSACIQTVRGAGYRFVPHPLPASPHH